MRILTRTYIDLYQCCAPQRLDSNNFTLRAHLEGMRGHSVFAGHLKAARYFLRNDFPVKFTNFDDSLFFYVRTGFDVMAINLFNTVPQKGRMIESLA